MLVSTISSNFIVIGFVFKIGGHDTLAACHICYISFLILFWKMKIKYIVVPSIFNLAQNG